MSWSRLSRTRTGRPVRTRERGEGGPGVALRFLAAEAAAHARTLHDDLVARDVQDVGHDGLNLRRVLRRGLDEHRAVLAGFGPGGLAFQIKMLLPAEGKFAGERGARMARAAGRVRRRRRRARMRCGAVWKLSGGNGVGNRQGPAAAARIPPSPRPPRDGRRRAIRRRPARRVARERKSPCPRAGFRPCGPRPRRFRRARPRPAARRGHPASRGRRRRHGAGCARGRAARTRARLPACPAAAGRRPRSAPTPVTCPTALSCGAGSRRQAAAARRAGGGRAKFGRAVEFKEFLQQPRDEAAPVFGGGAHVVDGREFLGEHTQRVVERAAIPGLPEQRRLRASGADDRGRDAAVGQPRVHARDRSPSSATRNAPETTLMSISRRRETLKESTSTRPADGGRKTGGGRGSIPRRAPRPGGGRSCGRR